MHICINKLIIIQSIKSSFAKEAGVHPQNVSCLRRSHALRSTPVRRGRLLPTVLHRWTPRHSILSADTLSWVPASDRPQTFISCFMHSSLVQIMAWSLVGAIIWTNAGILSIGLLWTNVSEILIEKHTFSFKKYLFRLGNGGYLSWPQCVKGLRC